MFSQQHRQQQRAPVEIQRLESEPNPRLKPVRPSPKRHTDDHLQDSSSTISSSADEGDSQDEDPTFQPAANKFREKASLSKMTPMQRERASPTASQSSRRLRRIKRRSQSKCDASSSASGASPSQSRRRSYISTVTTTTTVNNPAVWLKNGDRETVTSSTPTTASAAITLLERLIRTHPIWFQAAISRDEAAELLHGKEPGSFIIRQSSQPGTMAVSVRQSNSPSVEHYLIQQEDRDKLRLESSENRFENILSLVYHYSTVKEELPQLLVLPQTLRDVESRQNLSSLSLLGRDFWRYPMSFPDSRRNSVSILTSSSNNQQNHLSFEENHPTLKLPHQQQQPSTPQKPKRKISVCNVKLEPRRMHEVEPKKDVIGSASLLDETLFGLQEVSDMLQASLRELEHAVTLNGGCHSPTPFRPPPPPPLRSSSHRASPVSSPGMSRRRSDTEAMLRPITPPTSKQASPRSPRRRASSRHSVCRMVVTQVSEAKFPACVRVASPSIDANSTSPEPPQSISPLFSASSRVYAESASFSSSSVECSTTTKVTQNYRRRVDDAYDANPVHVHHSILHDHILPRFGIESQAATSSSYYRSSVADKMSDYEDIWCEHSSPSIRSITPAESENQFKAYLASKLQIVEGSLDLPCNNNNSLDQKDLLHGNHNNNNNTVSSSISSTSSDLSGRSVTSSKISSSTASSSKVARSTLSCHSKENLELKDSESSSTLSSNHQNPLSDDPVYSDPLDALERAEDTRVDNGHDDFGDDQPQPIYEDPKARCQPEKPNSASESEPETTSGQCDDVSQLEVLVEERPSNVTVEWREPSTSLERRTASDENLSAIERSSLASSSPKQCPLNRVRKWSSPASSLTKATTATPSMNNGAKVEDASNRVRKISSPPSFNLMTPKDRRSKGLENRLSAVIGKYIRPSGSQGVNKRSSWQVDSSSWEFLNESCGTDDVTPSSTVKESSTRDGMHSKRLEQVNPSNESQQDNPYDNLQSLHGEKVVLEECLKVESDKKCKDEKIAKNNDDPRTNSLEEKTSSVKMSTGELSEQVVSQTFEESSTSTTIGGATAATAATATTTTTACAPISSRERIQMYVDQLASERSSLLGQSISHFVTCTLESRETSAYVVMRNMRQFITGLKNYLTRSGEGDLWNIVEEERVKLNSDEFLNLDSVFEEKLHDLIVRPLQDHLTHLFNLDFETSGCLSLLANQMEIMRRETSKTGDKHFREYPDLNFEHVVQVCQESFQRMEGAFSPADKLANLLIAFKQIIHSSSPPQSNVDLEKFCHLFSVVISHCASHRIEIESELMWGLLPRPLLSAEAGYYLTLLSSSIHYLKTFQPSLTGGEGDDDVDEVEEVAEGQASRRQQQQQQQQSNNLTCSLDSNRSKISIGSSLITTNSLSSQTSRNSSKPQDPMKNILQVLVPDETSGAILRKSLPLKTGMTSRDLRKMIAHKLKITNDEDYALFMLHHNNGIEERLPENFCPGDQVSSEVTIVYRRQDAKIIWPASLMTSLVQQKGTQ